LDWHIARLGEFEKAFQRRIPGNFDPASSALGIVLPVSLLLNRLVGSVSTLNSYPHFPSVSLFDSCLFVSSGVPAHAVFKSSTAISEILGAKSQPRSASR
jgi:hypothetical protein